MELFRTDQYYIFNNGEHSLWWDRNTGEFLPKTGWDLASAVDPECLGVCHGIIGKIEHSVVDARLVIIKECSPVGHLHGNHVVYKIKSIAFLQIGNENTDLNLQICHKHKTKEGGIRKAVNSGLFDIQKNVALSKTWGTIKSAGNTIKSTTQQAAALAASQVKRRDSKDKGKFEKRILDELLKIFTDTDSFYFCRTGDITNSLQRQCELERKNKLDSNCLWKTVDDRFFWNKYMLKDLISLNSSLADPWILPVIQGFVQIEHCKVDISFNTDETKYETFTLSLISRRSRHRAGTRYKRRGVDDDGNCANYVETEQIVSYHSHQVSFVQVRGSVPIYWSQPGYKYRPPPRLDKGEEETQLAFESHFDNELKKYGPVCIINLVDQTGKEKVIWDAYGQHIFKYNSPDITYATFDFHEYCRGMHFENVTILINALGDVIRDMNYCWKDKQGQICMQKGVFRVNCIDCLDRTNVVQTALAKAVMEIQFTKLGLIAPEGMMPQPIRNVFQLLWANNGDIISKQYAGTNALKGDYTRTGERKFTGIMKDGMNSANRYYLSRFKDAYRQGTIDIMLGNSVSEDIFSDNRAAVEEDSAATAEHVKLLIEDCKKMLISNSDEILGSWGLIDADPNTGDPMESDMDTILILTRDSYYIADYDDQIDKVTKYQRVLLQNLTLIEFGLSDTNSSVLLFKNTARMMQHHCLRLNYKVDNVEGYYHMFRSTNLRFFNNMAVVIKNEEEIIESLKSICEAFLVALDICNLPSIPYYQGQKLDRRKSKLVQSGRGTNIYLDITFPQLTRNVSETQLLALKTAGTKALSNVSEQFSKLNRFGQSFNVKKNNKIVSKSAQSQFTIGKPKNDTSSESDDENEVSIFQPQDPNVDYYDPTINKYIVKTPIIPSEVMRIVDTSDIKPPDSFLPSVGIVMTSQSNENTERQPTLEIKENMNSADQTSLVDNVCLSSIISNVSFNQEMSTANLQVMEVGASRCSTPEITISMQDTIEAKRTHPPNTLMLDRKLSHSSGEVDDAQETTDHSMKLMVKDFEKRSNSEQDFTSNISQSQSESALKQIKSGISNITSPVANVTKDLVLSPFSKLAKGMQNLGANLDPRKMKSTGIPGGTYVKQITEKEYEEHRKLQEKWRKCNSRLVAL